MPNTSQREEGTFLSFLFFSSMTQLLQPHIFWNTTVSSQLCHKSHLEWWGCWWRPFLIEQCVFAHLKRYSVPYFFQTHFFHPTIALAFPAKDAYLEIILSSFTKILQPHTWNTFFRPRVSDYNRQISQMILSRKCSGNCSLNCQKEKNHYLRSVAWSQKNKNTKQSQKNSSPSLPLGGSCQLAPLSICQPTACSKRALCVCYWFRGCWNLAGGS